MPYLGLHVDAGAWIVDFHKQEDTNGCIFIVDPATPPNGSDELNNFEPKLITDILTAIGKTLNRSEEHNQLGRHASRPASDHSKQGLGLSLRAQAE